MIVHYCLRPFVLLHFVSNFIKPPRLVQDYLLDPISLALGQVSNLPSRQARHVPSCKTTTLWLWQCVFLFLCFVNFMPGQSGAALVHASHESRLSPSSSLHHDRTPPTQSDIVRDPFKAFVSRRSHRRKHSKSINKSAVHIQSDKVKSKRRHANSLTILSSSTVPKFEPSLSTSFSTKPSQALHKFWLSDAPHSRANHAGEHDPRTTYRWQSRTSQTIDAQGKHKKSKDKLSKHRKKKQKYNKLRRKVQHENNESDELNEDYETHATREHGEQLHSNDDSHLYELSNITHTFSQEHSRNSIRLKPSTGPPVTNFSYSLSASQPYGLSVGPSGFLPTDLINQLYKHSLEHDDDYALALDHTNEYRFYDKNMADFAMIQPDRDALLSSSSSSFPFPGNPLAELHSLSRSAHQHRRARYVEGNQLNITWPTKKSVELTGDVILGGLNMIHERLDEKICGPIMPQGGIQALEAMLFTIDYVNSHETILPNITLGAYILDDCDKDTYGLEQSIHFIKGSLTNIDDQVYECAGRTSRKHTKVMGVLGAASSATSIQVANLLRLFRIPQVSFFSTSSELSNKQRFEYFLRTVPSDKSQALAMVEIVKQLKWSYVSIIYEESIYGIRAFNDLEELLDQYDICIAIKERLTKDSGVAEDSTYDSIVKKLSSKPNAKGVIVFGSDQEVARLMAAVNRTRATGQFYWIGSDGWSARSLVFSEELSDQVEGTISVQPMANPVPNFEQYFLSLTPENNQRNPWFIEYWEHQFACKYPGSDWTPYNLNYSMNCTGKERISPDKLQLEGQLEFVSDAVLAFAFAIQDMHRELCPNTIGLPPECLSRMSNADGSTLLEKLKNVKFNGINGHEFNFASNGDGPARYRIIHYKQTQRGRFEWVEVGEYKEGELNLDLDKIQFRFHTPVPAETIISVCSQPCEKGQAKTYLEGEKCCFHCFNCTRYQVLVSETQCIDCPSGSLPDPEKRECIAIPEEYMRASSSWSIGALVFSWIGIFVTIFVIVIFIKYNDTPVVRASGRELCYVLLAGILGCYSMTFILVQKPTVFICGAQKAGIGLCFAVVYSALLTKTNRISRIFKASKKSARRPSFISPKSQLFICGGFILVQCLVILVWFAFSPPKVIHYHPTREDNKLICQASINAGYFVAFIYPIILIVVCTVYAVLTRNIPESFNESKFIGFTMYTTCIIWLAFVPIYFTSSQSNHIALNITTLSVSISLSATVTLLCLFTPKLYIILLHPEKNIRQSMMPQKYSKVNLNAKKVGNNLAEEPSTVIKNADAPCLVSAVSNTRVDSATQSDEYEMSVTNKSGDVTINPDGMKSKEGINCLNGGSTKNIANHTNDAGTSTHQCRCMVDNKIGEEARSLNAPKDETLKHESKSTQTVT